MIAFAWISTALAATVYVNGVRADILPEVVLRNVTVRVDAEGNIWIDAPGYRVEVAPPVVTESVPVAIPVTPPVAQPVTIPQVPVVSSASTTAAGVAQGAWWLVTEDNMSEGHTIDVVVNGTVVRRVRSGEPQIIVDLGPFLRPGVNSVTMNVIPGSAPPAGGVLHVYIGRGTNVAGTVRIDEPEIRYSRRATDGVSSSSRPFTLTVP